ncbi:MAG: response regulator [Burkholderiaceae bacterium]|nr:MAG: response regulator [Burkholderiaceae bacterium]
MSKAASLFQSLSGASDKTSEASPLAGKKVLIADRHASTRMALRDMVTQLGVANVINANSAGDVIRIVKNAIVDIILCEYKLDEVRDGQQLLEELRHEKLIPLSTMFMMITNERSYKQVVAVAEFAPDDYLLKPFTPDQLYQRLLRAFRKKQIFSKAYQLIEDGKIDAALSECDSVMTAQPRFAADALRLKIDMLNTAGRHEEAEQLLQMIVNSKVVPWAQMGLAVVRYNQDRLDEAEKLVEGLIGEKEEYLAAYDFLAEIKKEMGKEGEALEVLERAGSISGFNVKRMRKTGELAAATGDHTKAAQVFAKVVDRVRDSSLIRSADFSNLSKAFVAQGRLDEAEKVNADLKRTLRGAPDTEITAKLIEYQRLLAQNKTAEADEVLLQAVQLQLQNTALLPATMEADLAEACFDRSHFDHGFNIARKVALRGDIDKGVRGRIEVLLDQYRERQEARRKAAPLRKLPVDELIHAIKRLDEEGWSDELGELCRRNVEHWTHEDPASPEIQGAHKRLGAIMRKYGINAASSEKVAG